MALVIIGGAVTWVWTDLLRPRPEPVRPSATAAPRSGETNGKTDPPAAAPAVRPPPPAPVEPPPAAQPWNARPGETPPPSEGLAPAWVVKPPPPEPRSDALDGGGAVPDPRVLPSAENPGGVNGDRPERPVPGLSR
jgi:hypothetical protein